MDHYKRTQINFEFFFYINSFVYKLSNLIILRLSLFLHSAFDFDINTYL